MVYRTRSRYSAASTGTIVVLVGNTDASGMLRPSPTGTARRAIERAEPPRARPSFFVRSVARHRSRHKRDECDTGSAFAFSPSTHQTGTAAGLGSIGYAVCLTSPAATSTPVPSFDVHHSHQRRTDAAHSQCSREPRTCWSGYLVGENICSATSQM